METDEMIENQESEDEELNPIADSLKIQTFSRLPYGDETDSEKLTRIESLVDQINTKLGDEDDNMASYENMIQYFKSLKESCDGMLHKLTHEIEYTRSLEEKLKRKNSEYENIQLRKSLAESQATLKVTCENVQISLNETFSSIKASFDSFQGIINDKCAVLETKAEEIKSLKDQIDDIIVGYNKDLQKAASDQYTLLKNDCKELLVTSNERVGEIKESVLTFLKTCNEQNLALIRKVPEQKRKFCWLDVVVYALCGVCIVGMIVQMVV